MLKTANTGCKKLANCGGTQGKAKEMPANDQNIPAKENRVSQEGKNSADEAADPENGGKPVDGPAEYISQLKSQKLQAEKHAKELRVEA